MPHPLDLWLARQLRAQNDAALRERVPEDLLRLVAAPTPVPPGFAEGAGRSG